MKIALITDWLTSRGGMEHVNIAIAKLFPEAVIFTSVYKPDNFPELKDREVRTTFLQKLPKELRHRHQLLLPLFPKAFEKLDLSEFDLIISSSSSGFSKCVKKTRPEQKHICYCHTPVRFLYHARKEYLTEYPMPFFIKPFKFLLPALLNFLEKKDQLAIKGVDHFVSNSNFVGERIKKYYDRTAKTIYPCVDTDPFVRAGKNSEKGDYFLAVGRFIPYKKFDLLIKTFAQNKLSLKLVGKGPELEKCQKLAQKLKATNIEFLGFVERGELPSLFANARAFLFPAEEDFGLTPVEAMASGTPVIYLNKGGAKESVVRNCGISFEKQTTESIQKGIEDFLKKENSFDKKELSKRGQDFDEKVFQKNLLEFVAEIIGIYKGKEFISPDFPFMERGMY